MTVNDVAIARLSLVAVCVGVALTAAAPAASRTPGSRDVSSPRAASGAYDNYLAPASACPGNDSPTLLAAEQDSAMLCLIDYARAARGLGTLARSPLLAWSASIKGDDIVRCDDFSHTACGRPVEAPFAQAGYISPPAEPAVGENIAYGSNVLGSPRSIMRAWLESDGHRENLFDAQWVEHGIAMRKPGAFLSVGNNAVWVSHFGRPRTAVMSEDAGATPRALRLAVRPAVAKRGKRTRFRFVVTFAGRARERVAGATVVFAARRARTDSRGRATITALLRRPGRYRAVATKHPSRPASVTVRASRR